MVVYTCNPSCVGDRDGRMLVPGQLGKKKLNDTLLQKKVGGGKLHVHKPSYMRGRDRRIVIWGPVKNNTLSGKKKQNKN
jgi:hypothetical protein